MLTNRGRDVEVYVWKVLADHFLDHVLGGVVFLSPLFVVRLRVTPTYRR